MIQIERQLKDFARSSLGLFWQRQATFAGATLLAAYFVNIKMALICYGFCQICEFLDYSVARRVLRWDGQCGTKAAQFLNQLTLTAVFCSISVVLYILAIALAEGPSMHMGPLFFLFAATLYAAMNNCQIPRILITRLTIFSAVFVFIPVYDLWIVRPPLDSELWKQLGIVLFVLYFLIECSRKFLFNYISGLKHVEELCVERDRVTEAYKVQSQFVSIVSHELRTPLTSVKASLELLNSGMIAELPTELRSIAKLGQDGSNRLAVLIDDLLDFQKLKSGKMTLNLSQIELGEFVEHAVKSIRGLGEERGITLRTIDASFPVYVTGDRDRLMQVMTNVLSNAIKFSHRNGIVDISLDKLEERGKILVRDRGIGIPENSKHIVFEPFKQIECPDKRDYGGTGLGMSICNEILEGHGGSIDYSSEVGVGTTFVIELDLYSEFRTTNTGQKTPVAEGTLNYAAE
jgi:signal transduction histidine kinase